MSNPPRRRVALVLAFAALAGPATPAGAAPTAEIDLIKVRASDTDAAIKTADGTHHCYVNRSALAGRDGAGAARHELLLWLPGTQPPGATGDGPGGAGAFCELAAQLGYHAIVLKYPNEQSASICRNDRDPVEFERFRLALIAGGASRHLSLPRTESIEHRLVQLLRHLTAHDAAGGWDRFLADDGTPRWEAIAVAGQSQGGGHAVLIAIHRRVARVICTGGPKDFSLAHDSPAPWLRKESATPKDRFFTFNHRQDRQACSPAQQIENLRALGLDEFGPVVDVDQEAPPYRRSRMLTTDFPGTKLESRVAHTAVINPRNAGVFGPVWRYLLTEPVRP